MIINNINDLNKVFTDKLKMVISDVSTKVYDTLLECIESQIYDSPEGNYYERNHMNGGFISAFDFPIVKEDIDGVIANFFYNANKMVAPSNSNVYAHGNYKENIDRRNDMWWILNDKSSNSNNSDFGGAISLKNGKQGYLTKFNKIIKRDFDKWVSDSCKKHGLPVVNVGKYTTFIK